MWGASWHQNLCRRQQLIRHNNRVHGAAGGGEGQNDRFHQHDHDKRSYGRKGYPTRRRSWTIFVVLQGFELVSHFYSQHTFLRFVFELINKVNYDLSSTHTRPVGRRSPIERPTSRKAHQQRKTRVSSITTKLLLGTQSTTTNNIVASGEYWILHFGFTTTWILQE